MDYHRHDPRTPAHDDHPVKVALSASLDYVLRTGLASAVGAAMLPHFGPRGIAREKSLMPFYQALADRGEREAVFIEPPRQFSYSRERLRDDGLAALGGRADQLCFDSTFEALNPAVRAAYARHARNRRVPVRHWTHGDRPRRTLIFVHGYSLDAYWVNRGMFSLRWFFRQGWDIALFTLPFHGARRGRFDPFSGFGYFSHGIAQTSEAMLQSIHELRMLMHYLERRGVPGMGISGLSLGGYLSALLAAVDDRLAFAIPNAAVVSPADMLMEWPPLSTLISPALPLVGLDLPALRHAMAVHSPLTWRPLLDPDRLLIIAGAGDRFTGPRYQHLLHRHWAGSQLHWFPGNHVLHLHQRDYLRLMRDFMARCLPA